MRVVRKAMVDLLLWYLSNNPMRKLSRMSALARKLDRGKMHAPHIQTIEQALLDETSNRHLLVKKLFAEVDIKVIRKLVESFFVNANLERASRARAAERKYDCNIPWAILMDPTSACNLECTGCWASEYGQKMNLSFEELDDIIRQGKEHGTYFYLYSGGEPLVRKKDIIRLCEKHDDCAFLAFTNGTLIDDEFADEMLRVGNFVPAISVEGFEEATDSRRGK